VLAVLEFRTKAFSCSGLCVINTESFLHSHWCGGEWPGVGAASCRHRGIAALLHSAGFWQLRVFKGVGSSIQTGLHLWGYLRVTANFRGFLVVILELHSSGKGASLPEE